MTDVASQLRRAAAALQAGDPATCRSLCDRLLEARRDLWDARHLRGLAAAQAGDLSAAIRDLSAVHAARPQMAHAAFWLGRLLRQTDRLEEAVAPLERAAGDARLEVDARYELGRTFTRLRRTGEAENHYRRILGLRPDHADAAANLAFLTERRNRLEEAQSWADRALAHDPDNVVANLARATIDRRQDRPAAARVRLEALLRSVTEPLNRSIALNQLGQCFDAEGDSEAAFGAFSESNRILRKSHPLGQPVDHGPYGLKTLLRLERWIADHPVAEWSPNPHARPDDPVFLVGFPRSGTTLLDQVLSAHPDIEVCEERELFDGVRRDWLDGDGLARLHRLAPDELQRARDEYLAALREHRRYPGRPVVIDKLPLNLVYLGLVHRLFPTSRVVFALRDPRDACLSCFFQSFDLQGAMPYFLDLGDTARYYDAAMSLARATLAQIGNPVHPVRYEDTVEDLETRARGLLAFLQRPWNDCVLDYRQGAMKRSIDTPSYHQVVRPLYRSSIGRWRRYAWALGPWEPSLARWVEHFEYPA